MIIHEGKLCNTCDGDALVDVISLPASWNSDKYTVREKCVNAARIIKALEIIREPEGKPVVELAFAYH